MRGPDG
ncbi:Protein of unknown function [Thermobacillus xylanilyticus]|nr:Protein of unknown function [Thermobacillus xylanilyticus]